MKREGGPCSLSLSLGQRSVGFSFSGTYTHDACVRSRRWFQSERPCFLCLIVIHFCTGFIKTTATDDSQSHTTLQPQLLRYNLCYCVSELTGHLLCWVTGAVYSVLELRHVSTAVTITCVSSLMKQADHSLPFLLLSVSS